MKMLRQTFHSALMEVVKSSQPVFYSLYHTPVAGPQAICHQALLSPSVAGWDGHRLGEPLAG